VPLLHDSGAALLYPQCFLSQLHNAAAAQLLCSVIPLLRTYISARVRNCIVLLLHVAAARHLCYMILLLHGPCISWLCC
jgi:predicted HD phosphohydrolase